MNREIQAHAIYSEYIRVSHILTCFLSITQINSNGANSRGVRIEAVSPFGVVIPCEVTQQGNSFHASFIPKQIGEWMINITYNGDHIASSPFTCLVYDPSKLKVSINESHSRSGCLLRVGGVVSSRFHKLSQGLLRAEEFPSAVIQGNIRLSGGSTPLIEFQL